MEKQKKFKKELSCCQDGEEECSVRALREQGKFSFATLPCSASDLASTQTFFLKTFG